MLVNEDGEILAVNTNEEDRLSIGKVNHVYPLMHFFGIDRLQLERNCSFEYIIIVNICNGLCVTWPHFSNH